MLVPSVVADQAEDNKAFGCQQLCVHPVKVAADSLMMRFMPHAVLLQLVAVPSFILALYSR